MHLSTEAQRRPRAHSALAVHLGLPSAFESSTFQQSGIAAWIYPHKSILVTKHKCSGTVWHVFWFATQVGKHHTLTLVIICIWNKDCNIILQIRTSSTEAVSQSSCWTHCTCFYLSICPASVSRKIQSSLFFSISNWIPLLRLTFATSFLQYRPFVMLLIINLFSYLPFFWQLCSLFLTCMPGHSHPLGLLFFFPLQTYFAAHLCTVTSDFEPMDH